MLKAYGTCGMVKVYVQDGLLPQEGMLALVEPFNLLEAVYRQSGELVFFKDILSLEPLSYLSLKDYSSYLWMEEVASFVERWFLQYEAELFNLAVSYLTLRPPNPKVFLLKFKLEALQRMGLYKEEVFKEGLREVARCLVQEEKPLRLSRLRLPLELLSDLEQAVEVHLSNSL